MNVRVETGNRYNENLKFLHPKDYLGKEFVLKILDSTTNYSPLMISLLPTIYLHP